MWMKQSQVLLGQIIAEMQFLPLQHRHGDNRTVRHDCECFSFTKDGQKIVSQNLVPTFFFEFGCQVVVVLVGY